jgi:ACT domain-containing protein
MDKDMLNYEMRKRKVNIKTMCSVLGLSRSAFYRKCNGISEFTQTEIQTIVDYLGLESPVGIFFSPKVS